MDNKNYSSLIVNIYNHLTPIFRFFLSENAAELLIKIDTLLVNKKLTYNGLIFILLKDTRAYSDKVIKTVKTSDIINFKVPHFKLQTNANNSFQKK